MINQRIISLYVFLVSIVYGNTSYARIEKAIGDNKPRLDFHVRTLSFIKNNEYFTPILEGHTLAGYQAHPFLAYTASENISTKLGFFIRRYWAERKLFSKIIPTFTIKYQNQSFKFLIGNIHEGIKHRLISPLYDKEIILRGNPENGLQINYLDKNTFLDIWLDWLTLLDKHNNTPEELVAGLSFEQRLIKTSRVTIRLPLQSTLYHLGGQGIPIKDFILWMGAIGANIKFNIGSNQFLRSIELNNYGLANAYIKQVKRPDKLGYGFLNQIIFNTKWFKLEGVYWNGYGFSSENLGHPIYQSISIIDKQVKYREKHRQLILIHLSHKSRLAKDLKLIFHLDPYYDINKQVVEHEAGLYLNYKLSFKLKSF